MQILNLLSKPKSISILSTLLSIVPSIFIALYVAGGIAINLNLYWQYSFGYYDFGIFDRAIWSVAHFKAPVIDHFIVPGRWIFADHFNPSLMLLAPIYWITERSEAIIMIPSIAVGISAIIVYQIGIKILKNRFLSFAVVFTYLMSIGMQNAVYSDVHELTVATVGITWCYWAIISKKLKTFLFALIFTLGFKENLFLFGIGTSIFINFYNKSWRKIAIITFIISALWGIAAIKFIIPYFSGNEYYYANPESLAQNPIELIQILTTPFIKVQTVFYSFANYAFLSLGYVALLPTLVFNFVSRFLTPGSTRWDLGLHYNAEIAPTFAVSTILTIAWLKKFLPQRLWMGLGIVLILNTLFFHRILFHGPMGLAYHPAFYQNTKNHEFLNELVSKIPADASVVAQNNLAAHFTHQPEIWILRENYAEHKADYIVMDFREGQYPSNLLGIQNSDLLLKTVQQDKNYFKFFQEGDQYIFKRSQ